MTASEIDASRSARTRTSRTQGGLNNRLNWLRAAVLGANDGIVSTAGIVIGVAGATSDRTAIVIAGVAGLTAGAMSMAAGEYVSVSTQRDSELALLAKERRELREEPEEELAELAGLYVDKGLSEELALQVAARSPTTTRSAPTPRPSWASTPTTSTSPWQAAWASMLAFTVGALLPLLTMTLAPPDVRLWVTVIAVVVALAGTGWTTARLGYGRTWPGVLRNVAGGAVRDGGHLPDRQPLGTQVG